MIYRTLLAMLAAAVIASPVFAADETTTGTTTDGTTMTTDGTTTQETATDGTTTKVNINTATTKQLMRIKGINAPKARAIVSYRKKHGEFKTTDDLANVKGFKKLSPTALQRITDQLTIE